KESLRHVWNEMNLRTCLPTLFRVNQVGGFDCPGCAWPDPQERSRLGEYCENGVKALAEEATTRRVGPAFFQRHSVAELSRWPDFRLGKSGRLTHPMILRPGATHYEPLEWEEAFRLIARELQSLGSPDEAVFYTSGRTSNEAAFLYQLFVRQFGTNNLPDCSNMCHESSGVALSETLGIGKGSVRLEDFYCTELILILGQNPGTNHPRMLSALEKAKRAGARIIAINPLKEAGLLRFRNPQEVGGWVGGGTPLADLYLQVRINGDVPLLQALQRLLLEREERSPGTVLDHDFIAQKTEGFEALREHLRTLEVDALSEACGVPRAELETAADWLAASRKIIACWAMGLTQHRNAVANIREIVNLLLMKGAIGKPGAGTCPVRGHSNVQGDRTVGIWDKPSPAFLDRLQAAGGFSPPRHPGLNTVQAIRAMLEGKVKVFFALGGNFLSATPDTERTAQALQNCRLTVQVSTKLNRSHLITGHTALILPCLGRTEKDVQAAGEQFVSVENSMGIVHASRGHLEPASPYLLSEPAIVARLAAATLPDSPTDWLHLVEDYDRIRDLIEKVIPGFEDYNRRVRQPGGFYLPNGAREGRFDTAVGKARFTINPLPEWRLQPGEFLLMTIRSHDQFNTTIYGLDDRYRGIRNGRRILFMHPEDIRQAGLSDGRLVNLTSHYDGLTRRAEAFRIVAYDIPRGCLATYFPEANPLVPFDRFAEKSQTPISKSVVVRIEARE
ncbi:MAG: hypothetical protein D6765_02945, partial [Bacteroidetes bacterium]